MPFLPLDHVKIEHRYNDTDWQDFTGALSSVSIVLRELTGKHTGAVSFYDDTMDPSQSSGTRVVKEGDRVRFRARTAAGRLRHMVTMQIHKITVDIDLTKPPGRTHKVNLTLHGNGHRAVGGTAGPTGVAILEELSNVITAAPFEINGAGTSRGNSYAWTGAVEGSTSTETDFDGLVRTNLCITPSFEAGVGSWASGAGATLAVDAGWAEDQAGAQSLKISPTGASTESYAELFGAADGLGAFLPGDVVTISATCRLTAAQGGSLHSRARAIYVSAFLNAGGEVDFTSDAAPNAAGETRVSITFTIPADGSGSVRVRLYNGSTTTGGGDVWWDAVLIEKAAEAGDYFDGSTGSDAGITTPTGVFTEAAVINDASELDQIVLTRDSNPGLVMFEDPYGAIQMFDPDLVRVDTRWTIGPEDYSKIDPSFDTSHVINVLTIRYVEKVKTGTGHTRKVEHDHKFEDTASKHKYGPRKKTVTVHKKLDWQAYADQVFARNADPIAVPASVVIPIRTAAELLPGYEDGAYIGSKVDVVMPDGVTTFACRVERIAHQITSRRWLVQVFLRNPNLVQRPRTVRAAVDTEVANNPDGTVLNSHIDDLAVDGAKLADVIDATGKAVTNPLIRTAETGARIEINNQADPLFQEGSLIAFYTSSSWVPASITSAWTDDGTIQVDTLSVHGPRDPASASQAGLGLSFDSVNGALANLDGDVINLGASASAINAHAPLAVTGAVTATGDIHGQDVFVDSVPPSSQAANTHMGPTGRLFLISSRSELKLEQLPLDADDVRGVLDLRAITWFDRGEVEENGGSTDGLRRIPGVTAEDVEQHAPVLATYQDDGTLQGVAYDRIAVALIPILREQQQTIARLSERLEALERNPT